MKCSKGQAMVETALILPIIILIIAGIFDFGFMFNQNIIILNASREGARSAAVGSSDAEIINVVNNAAVTLDQTKLSVTINPSDSVRRKGDAVTVTVQYDYTFLTPIMSGIINRPIQLRASDTMRVE
jgi:Flp pilus assembly protein TadG